MKRVVAVTEFKANCGAYLDEVERGGTLTITRRGKPVGLFSPAPKKKGKWINPKDMFAGKIQIVGDIVHGDPELWECTRKG